MSDDQTVAEHYQQLAARGALKADEARENGDRDKEDYYKDYQRRQAARARRFA